MGTFQSRSLYKNETAATSFCLLNSFWCRKMRPIFRQQSKTGRQKNCSWEQDGLLIKKRTRWTVWCRYGSNLLFFSKNKICFHLVVFINVNLISDISNISVLLTFFDLTFGLFAIIPRQNSRNYHFNDTILYELATLALISYALL